MRCPECVVAEIPPGARSCPQCGYVVTARGGAGEAPWNPRSGQLPPVILDWDGEERPAPPRPALRRPATRAGAAAAVLLGLVVGAAGTWILLGGAGGASRALRLQMPGSEADTVALSGFITDSTSLERLGGSTTRKTADSTSAAPTSADPAPRPAPQPPTPTVTRVSRVPAAPRRPPRPSPTPTRPRQAEAFVEPELPPPEATPSPDLAHLSVNAVPWGYVSVDSVPVGNTPLLNLSLPPGRHIVRVERDGFRPWERDVQLTPGQVVRITDIGLVRQ